jgi:hypothetical protein
MNDAPRKTRPPTSPFTWACAVAIVVVAAVGGYWWYVTAGPGRIVDASGVQPGMSRFEVSVALGEPDEIVIAGDESAMRYGRTHVWLRGMPGRGDAVTKVTTEPLFPF